jgi:hypothetical protein
VSETPAQPDAFGLPHGVMVAGAGAFVMALLAEIRAMSFCDVLEMVWGAILGLFWLVGAVLRGFWSFVCGCSGGIELQDGVSIRHRWRRWLRMKAFEAR